VKHLNHNQNGRKLTKRKERGSLEAKLKNRKRTTFLFFVLKQSGKIGSKKLCHNSLKAKRKNRKRK
jgi:hypothetical protein